MIETAALPAETPDGAVIDLAHLLSGITNLAGVLIVRADDRIVYANQRFVERWEVPKEAFDNGFIGRWRRQWRRTSPTLAHSSDGSASWSLAWTRLSGRRSSS